MKKIQDRILYHVKLFLILFHCIVLHYIFIVFIKKGNYIKKNKINLSI